MSRPGYRGIRRGVGTHMDVRLRIAGTRAARVLVATVVLGGLGAAPARADRPLPTYTAVTLDSPTPQANGRFGWSVRTVGDIDGDGVDDVGIGSIGQDVGPFAHAGRAWVFSGRTQKILLTLHHPQVQSDGFGNFGSSVLGLGDVNGDGTPDIAIGAFRQAVNANAFQGKVYVFSGSSGNLLYTVDDPHPQAGAVFGDRYAATMNDLNGDGVRDFVETSSFETVGICTADFDFNPATPDTTGPCTSVGAVYAFSGKDGALLHEFAHPDPPQAFETFGQGVGNPGDVNGDGADDLVIGAASHINADGTTGAAYLADGKTGNVLRTLPSQGGGFGLMVGDGIAPGDVSGDGVPDLYVGAPGQTVGGASVGAGYLLSGATGALLRTLSDPAPIDQGSFGYAYAGAGDLNGDGTPDILAMRNGNAGFPQFGAPANRGAAYVFDPRTGAVLSALPGMAADGPGDAAASPGDINADGYPDYFLGGADIKVGANAAQGRVIVDLSQAPAGPAAPAAPAAAAPPPAAVTARDTVKPVLSALRLLPPSFRAARSGSSVVTRRGSRVSFRLSEDATVRFTVERAVSGRRVGGRCVTSTPARRHAKRCTRYIVVRGSFGRAGHAGSNAFRFSGRIGGRTLRAGHYRLRARATDPAGNPSALKRSGFSILGRR